VWAGGHQLAFDWSGLTPTATGSPTVGVAGRAKPGGALGGSASADTGAANADPNGTGQDRTVAGASADAKLAVRRFVALCVEVLNGYRPAAHLRRLSRPGEAAGVIAQAHAAAHRVADLRRGAGQGQRGADRRGRRPDPVAVLKLRFCEPRPGVVEAAVLLVTGGRTWAVAVRLEQHQQSWAATTLRLV
jgi:hypothetical protein